jgi:hypothetical protein
LKAVFSWVLLACALTLASACANEELAGCQKDTDCIDGRICDAGACTYPQGDDAGATCAATGEGCSVNNDCCNFQTDDGSCVSGICADACATDAECESGCCAPLDSGGRACAPTSICEQVCVDAGQSCAVNNDCCAYRGGEGFCVDGTCADACSEDEMCVSTCCAELQSGGQACAPIEVCL